MDRGDLRAAEGGDLIRGEDRELVEPGTRVPLDAILGEESVVLERVEADADGCADAEEVERDRAARDGMSSLKSAMCQPLCAMRTTTWPTTL